MRIFLAAIAVVALFVVTACSSPSAPPDTRKRTDENGRPILFTIAPDRYHAKYAGTAEDGRKFFLSDKLFDWVGDDDDPTGFVGLFLWHADGTFDEVHVDRVGRAKGAPRGQAVSADADDLVDKRLRQLGKYKIEPITVEPFTKTIDGVMFGWEIGQYEDGMYYVGIRPGDFMVYYEPWDGEHYDT